jgi:serine/threonine protein kinase
MNDPNGASQDPPRVLSATFIADAQPEQVGNVVGPYKLLQRIGEGGFGVVYMAEQERPVRRVVALKIIKPGMDTGQVIARFESERQALALMDHPNIAKVLDAGATASGHPYFIMELVKGVPITEFCDKKHSPPDVRLKLFVDVCHAIQHAHHKGIIHRDIKPTNVLVTLNDGVPMVKVIDFGVAKATVQKLTEKTLFTAFGQLVGTPEYMSPEQAEMSGLDIDTRSDVYSLGVLLYELLTGTTPLEAKRLREAGYAKMQKLIQEEELPRPSTRLSSLGDTATVVAVNRGLDVRQLAQLLSGDLDWVVMKALEKDRDRRYSTPGTFAEDIERYLRHEAISARPPSRTYRLKKLVRRNRAVVLTAAAVGLALVAETMHLRPRRLRKRRKTRRWRGKRRPRPCSVSCRTESSQQHDPKERRGGSAAT